MSEVLLDFNNVTMQFGGVTALSEVTLQIQRGEILGLIGPNGAGKTTCFNVMTGVYSPTIGSVTFNSGRLQLTAKSSFAFSLISMKTTVFNSTLLSTITSFL